jgi:hypothetical protein
MRPRESAGQRAMQRAYKIANRLHDMWKGAKKGGMAVSAEAAPNALQHLSAA